MNRKVTFFVFVLIIILFCSSCNTTEQPLTEVEQPSDEEQPVEEENQEEQLPEETNTQIDLSTAEYSAKVLYDLGLFTGKSKTSFVPDLEGSMNRQEAMKMIVVALGWEPAKATQCPFEDVDDWAKPYVAKAYMNGITLGYTETNFGAKDPVSLIELYTFYLRALGYETTYAYENAEILGNETGLSKNMSDNTDNLKRYDLVTATYNVLTASKKGRSKTLIEELIINEKVKRETAIIYELIDEYIYQWQRDNGTKEITVEQFESEVLNCATPVLVEFYINEDELCNNMKKIVDELASELANEVKVVRIDGETCEEIVNEYNITSYPTLKLLNKDTIEVIPAFEDTKVLVDWVRSLI